VIGMGRPSRPGDHRVPDGRFKLTSPLKTISSYPAVMAVTMASAERLFEILDEPSAE
jgi:hypothetical protein